ncbi:MAG: hypothetical protein HYY06_26205 [Deltaproteobacteria bacterium]|nr:hypothetical protein [Deltaproteobacteria bacterium]
MVPSPSIAVLCNPRARGAARDPMLPDRLRRITGHLGLVKVTWDVEAIPDAVDASRKAGCTVYAVCGGDGASMHVLSALRSCFGSAMPPVALLPAGTVNTVARRIGVQGNAEAALRRLVAMLESGAQLPLVEHDTLEVGPLEGPSRVGFIFGAGLVSSFFELYSQANMSGRLWAAAQIGRIFVGSFVGSGFASRVIAPVEATLSIDGEASPLERFTLLLASTLRDVGLGLRVTYRAGSAPGKFHIVGTDLPATRLGPQLTRVLRGQRLAAEPLVDAVAGQALLSFGAEARYLLDGELFAAQSVQVRAGPRVRFAVP